MPLLILRARHTEKASKGVRRRVVREVGVGNKKNKKQEKKQEVVEQKKGGSTTTTTGATLRTIGEGIAGGRRLARVRTRKTGRMTEGRKMRTNHQ